MTKKRLSERYGVDVKKKEEVHEVMTTEDYREYDRQGNVVKGVSEVRT